MFRLYPPVVPGLTDVPEGSKSGKTLYQLVTLQRRQPTLFPPPVGDLIRGIRRDLFTSAEPPPEPVMAMSPPLTGRSLGGR